MERRSSGFLPGFTPRRCQRRMPGAGTGIEHLPGANCRTSGLHSSYLTYWCDLMSHLNIPVAADPGGQGGRIGVAVAGNEVDDLDGLLAVPGDRAPQLRDLGGSGEPGPGRASTTLMVRRARRPWSVLTAETAGTAVQGSFLSCRYKVGMLALTVIT
jgi:hypothetical protein